MILRKAGNALLILCGVCGPGMVPSLAGDLTASADLTTEIFASDNIFQASEGEEESDIGLRLFPTLGLESRAGRLNWNLDLGAEARAFALASDSNRIEPVLTGNAEAELLPENLFLNGLINLRQSFAQGRARGASGRGAGLTEDRTGVFSFAMGPIWRSNFRGYANLEARYQYEFVKADDVIDATQNHRVNIDIADDRRFEQLDWQLSYVGEWSKPSGDGNNGTTTTDDSGNTSRQEFRGDANYPLTNELALSVVAGYDDGEGDNAEGDETEGGFYWSVGGTWNPSRVFAFRLLLGDKNREFQVTFSPSRRTDLEVSVVDRDVGRDAGITWNARLNHRTRYSNWALRYQERSTSQAESEVADVTGDPVFDQVDEVLNPDTTLGLTDENFFRRRLQANVDYNRGRTLLGIRGAFEKRDYGGDGGSEQTVEAGLTWRWLLGRRTSSVVDIEWEDADFRNGGNEVFLSLTLGLAYVFAEDLEGLLSFSHLNRDNADDGEDFSENRLGLLLRMEF